MIWGVMLVVEYSSSDVVILKVQFNTLFLCYDLSSSVIIIQKYLLRQTKDSSKEVYAIT